MMMMVPDGGGDDAATIEVMRVAERPALPTFTPCPAGWVEVARGELAACEPFPEAAQPCARTEARFPGEASCTRIGDACPASSFPALPAHEGKTWFVLAGARDGDGGETRPFATITEALAAAARGDRVVIGRGTYDEALVVPRGLT